MESTTNVYGIDKCEFCGKNDFRWVNKNGQYSMRSFLNHLRQHNISFKEYYDKFLRKENEGICQRSGCNKSTPWKAGSYQLFCSNFCAQNDERKKNIIKNRFVNAPDKKEIWYQRRMDSAKKRGEWGNVQKQIQTVRETASNLGMTESEYRSQFTKMGAMKIDKDRRKEITQKAMKTKIARGNHKTIGYYYQYKWYNKSWNIQGYEPFILDVLQYDLNVGEHFVERPNVQNQYLFEYNNHLYYPDFVLKIGNGVLIEVKSTWTFQSQKDTFYQKGFSVINSGYSFLPIIFRLSDLTNFRGRWNDRKIQEWWSTGNSLRECLKKVLDWVISSQTSNPGAYWYDVGSTTILHGSTRKCGEMAETSIKRL